MQTDHYTFWSLLTAADELGKPLVRYLQVPIIQRDYAQGRPDAQATAVRTGLLAALRDALTHEQPLTLDFVYGELDQARRFVPLDGQQRLTTLFLLHWYLALRAGRLSDADVQAVLGKFSYETRSSARDFCRRLVSTPPTAWQEYPTISQALCDQAWYQPAWAHDPTVAAMLVVLDALHDDTFGAEAAWFGRLTDPARPIVGFYWLEMQRVGLSDDLYLKMNARGKPLTGFENWKAQFDLLLQAQGRAGEFGQKADNAWTDFFWQHRRPGVTVVDECFGRYLHYFTRMLAYRRPDLRADTQLKELTTAGALPFAWFERVYDQPESVALLFGSLDFLAHVQKTHPQGLSGLLKELFTKKAGPERVRLFGHSQVDLFGQLLRDPSTAPDPAALLQEQVLLFGLLTYGATVAADAFALPHARNLLRVLRNLLERTRQQEDTVLKSDLRARDLPAFADACAALATAAEGRSPDVYERLAAAVPLPGLRERGVAHERQKATLLRQSPKLAAAVHELENQDVLRGDLHNLHPDANAAHLQAFAAAVRDIWGPTLPQSLIIRAWLTAGDYRRTQGRGTGGGRKYYFGNDRDWYLILATDLEANQPNLLPEFLQAYAAATGSTPTAKLSRLITNWLRDQQQRDTWRYYFVKYAEMTANSLGSFAWNSNFELRLLSKPSIKGWHINPLVRSIMLRGHVADVVGPADTQWTYGDWPSPLWLHHLKGVRKQKTTPALTCRDNAWVLLLPTNYAPPAGLQASFRLRPTAEGTWLLPATASRDRIRQAEKFIQALHEQGVEYHRPTP
ncbi:DUF262 domain-containing protein [Hymenobacter elongatus]|uniref:DUF262 domain-containing protein n=1 Tax=Hymenobacter elongatus TaxID=877208 RepID=A0A4Z0PIS2_9BACT|nr:DUF262 domain-containing protein [Hymenobacter elongatus]TGE15007.1 DUF262 domain-containing protein [Hymenobacter elongatus]